jgi:hypothetical protein
MSIFKLFKYLLIDQFMLWGGGGKGGSAPSAPDPNVVAAATTKTNTDTAAFNKALNLNNYSNPFGSQQTTQTGTDPNTGAPIYNTSVSANPQLQGALSSLLGQAGNSGSVNQSAMNGLSDLSGYLAQNGGLAQQVGRNYQDLSGGALGLNSQYQNLSNSLGGLNNGYQNLMGSVGQVSKDYGNLNNQYASLAGQLDQGQAKQAQQQGQDAAYKAQTQYLDPQFSQQNESLSAQLANQGLTPGSEAYNNAMTNFNNTKQQAYSNAQNQSIMTGSQIGAQNLQNQIAGINTQSGLLGAQGQNLSAQSGLIGQNAGLLGNQANTYGQQANMLNGQAGLYGLAGTLNQGQLGAIGTDNNTINQRSSLYGQQVGIGQTPYSNLSSIASMIPGYSGTGQASANPADIAGLYNNQYQSQLANYNAQQQSSNNTMSGLFGLGSAGIMGLALSDRRAKRAIKRVSTWVNGLGVYTYRYMWEPKHIRHLGFMADEVKKLAPFAVVRGADGFDRVNYQLAGSAR